MGSDRNRGSAGLPHILILAPAYPTPDAPVSGIFFRDQAAALQRAGFRVGVIAPRSPFADLIRQGRVGWPHGVLKDTSDGFPVLLSHLWFVDWDGESTRAALSWARWGMRIFERYRLEEETPDLIHAHGALGAGTLAEQIRSRFHIPYVLTEHSSRYSRKIPASQRAVVTSAFRNAAAKLVVSPSLGHDIERNLGPSVQPWIHVPNLVSPEFLPPEQLASPPPFRYLNIARMADGKGQEQLLEAFSRAFRRDGEVELTLVGEGPCLEALKARAELLGIADRVRFTGLCSRPAVIAEIQRAHSLACSSRHETFGVVLIEALACGKPVISTRCGGPEYIVGEGDGILVEPGDIRGFAHALTRLRDQYRNYFPEDLRNRCLARFGEDAIIGKLLAIYRDVLRRKRVFDKNSHALC